MDFVTAIRLVGFVGITSLVFLNGTLFGNLYAAPETLEVLGVSVSNSHIKVTYRPVPGAKDYRIYDVTSPNNVKYAGQIHMIPDPACPGASCNRHFVTQADGVTPVFPYQVADGATGGPQVLDVLATQIDWNNIGDNQPHTLIIEAVNLLGPVPPANLYNAITSVENVPFQAGGMMGSNKGPTPDGKNSTNGQGPYTNNPQAIAQSRPFIVQANPNYKAIPSKGTATQTFFDTFENSENSSLTLVSRNDTIGDIFDPMGRKKYTLNAGTNRAWDIEYRSANNRDSMPFIANDHFMDMLFSGATPGTSAPTHNSYASMAMTPIQTFDITNGKIAHLTMEVDGHVSFRRWMDFNIAPASDPLQGWTAGSFGINNSGRAIFLELRDSRCNLSIYNGIESTTTRKAIGQEIMYCDAAEMYVPKNFTKNASGFDDKSRYDLFLSQTHLALFQDGKLIDQVDIPTGSFAWGNQPLKAYFTHYLYHSSNDIDELMHFEVSGNKFCYPMNSYWFNNPGSGTTAGSNVCNAAYPAGYGFQHSDERHWDNMGFEVLPASEAPANNFASLSSLVQLPVVQAPVLAGSPPGASSTPTPQLTNTPTSLLTNTPTPMLTSTPTPTFTKTPTPTFTKTPTPTPNGLPLAPTDLLAVPVSMSQINLTWKDNANNEDGFKIERSSNGINFTQISTLGSNTTSYASTGLGRARTYHYRVRAYNSMGNSSYSATVSATTPAL